MNALATRGLLLPLALVLTSCLYAAPLQIVTEAAKTIVSPGESNAIKVFLTNPNPSMSTTFTGVVVKTTINNSLIDTWNAGTIPAFTQIERTISYVHTPATVGSTDVANSVITAVNPASGSLSLMDSFDIEVGNLLFEWSDVSSFSNDIRGGSSIDRILPAQGGTDIRLSVTNFDPNTTDDHIIEWDRDTITNVGTVVRLQMHEKPLFNFVATPTLRPFDNAGKSIFSAATFTFDPIDYPQGITGLQFFIYDIDTSAYYDTRVTPSVATGDSGPTGTICDGHKYGTWRDSTIVFGYDIDGNLIIPSTSISSLNTLSQYLTPQGVCVYAGSGVNNPYTGGSTNYSNDDPRGRVTYRFPVDSKLRTLVVHYFDQTPIQGLCIVPNTQLIYLSNLYRSENTDLGLSLISAPESAEICETIDYTLTVTNLGLADAADTKVTNLLPSQFEFITASTSQGSFDSNTGIWTVGLLPRASQSPNNKATITITARVRASALLDTPITFTAMAMSNSPETDLDNNKVTIIIPITTVLPTAIDDYATTNENVSTMIDVVANDSGCDLLPSTVSVIDGPDHGTASVNPITGKITYTPDMNFTGTDTLQYIICDEASQCDTAYVYITVIGEQPAQTAPIAVKNNAVTDYTTPVSINVLANDIYDHALIGPSDVSLIDQPAHGSATVNPITGLVTYTPNPGFFGNEDPFHYQICNSVIDPISMSYLCSSTAICVVVLQPEAKANNDYATTNDGIAATINVLQNDIYYSFIEGSLSITDGPSCGTAFVNPDNTITYIPTTECVGLNNCFSYQFEDGIAFNSPVSAQVCVYVNRPPVAPDLSRCALSNKSITFYLFSRIQKGDGILLKPLEIVDQPAHGNVIANANGSITYTPNPGYQGPDSFSYQVCDSNNLCDTATITLDVQPGILLVGGGQCVPLNSRCSSPITLPQEPPVSFPV